MAVYKQCITDVSPIRVTAGYPAYSDGSPHRGIDTVHGDHKAYAPESAWWSWPSTGTAAPRAISRGET